MFRGDRRICKFIATFISVIFMFKNGTSTVDASRRIINCMEVTSSNTEKVKILNYGFDQSGLLNMSFLVVQPWDHMKVRLYIF